MGCNPAENHPILHLENSSLVGAASIASQAWLPISLRNFRTAAQRLLGVFVFLLALAIAFPLLGFNMPQAIAIFIIGLGLPCVLQLPLRPSSCPSKAGMRTS
jgi:hypothetical protein